MSAGMDPTQLRGLIEAVEIDERDPGAMSITIEQIEGALHAVLDELEEPVGGASVVVVNRYRLAGRMAEALGLEVAA